MSIRYPYYSVRARRADQGGKDGGVGEEKKKQ